MSYKFICEKIIKPSGALTLGIGTMLLGIAALCKIPEITDAVNNVKGLNEAIIEVESIGRKNTSILNKLENQILSLSSFLSILLSKPSKENEELILSILRDSLQKQDRAMAFAGAEATLEKKSNEIIEQWRSLDSDLDRAEYLKSIFNDLFSTEY